MKLLSFTPWKHTTTSIPCSSSNVDADDIHGEENDILQRVIISPPGSSTVAPSSSKRIKSLSLSSSLDMQPIMTLVSHHRLCILGRSERDRSSSTVALDQVPQWIYSSRPGDASSFIPNISDTDIHRIHRRVGAVVDPTSRTVFVLQNDNRTMKVWGLDDDVNGPDDDSGVAFQNGTSAHGTSGSNGVSNSSKLTTSLIQKVEWDSPVLSMYPIPMKRQIRVKIKGSQLQATVKKRGGGAKTTTSSGSNIINGGVVGFLANGQMFVVLVCPPDGNNSDDNNDNHPNCSRSIKVGIYGNDNSSSSSSSSTAAAKFFAENYIHSIVGFHNLTTCQPSKKTKNVGQNKRKFDSIANRDEEGDNHDDDDDDEWGEVTITSLSKDARNGSCIAYCKHSLRISSSFTKQQQQLNENGAKSQYYHRQKQQYQSVNGKYSKEMGRVKLPHRINRSKSNAKNKVQSNGSSAEDLKKYKNNKDVHVTQLDSIHVGLVYQESSTKVWYTTIIDTRSGECTVNPFPLRRHNLLNKKNKRRDKSASNSNDINDAVDIVNIGGLSNSILAVLTSDNILSIYDARRAVILHELNVHSLLGKEDNSAEKKYKFGIGTHWFNGTIAIICNEVSAYAKKSNGSMTNTKNSSNTISVSYARVGIFDADEKEEEVVGIAKKPFVKGSYNLARIISSSLATTEWKKSSTPCHNQVEVQPFVSDMINWYPSKGKKIPRSSESTLANYIEKLEMYRPTSPLNDSPNTETFFDLFKEAKEKLSKPQKLPSTAKLLNGTHSTVSKPSSGFDSTLLPRTLIDVSISIAIDVILAQSGTRSDTISAVNVLLQCIETGMVSGRNNFSASAVPNTRKNGETLRLLLLTLQAQNTVNEESVDWPLCLISGLLQQCKDGLTEQMLVSMLHFVMCYPSEKQFAAHWKNSAQENAWYKDSEANLLEKRLKKAVKQYDNAIYFHKERSAKRQKKNVKEHDNAKALYLKKCEELQNLVKNLEKQCAVSHQLFFIRKIVTHSKCNPALLRSALQSGLTQTDSGEVEVLMQALGKILRKAGKEQSKMKRIDANSSHNSSKCISQWLSAVVDTNLGTLLNSSNAKIMEQVKREVTASISQTQAILSLKDLLDQVSEVIESKKDKKSTVMEAPVPLYGIEPLIF